MKELSGETILLEFCEHSYINENGSEHGLNLFWIRDTVAIFKKEISILIDLFKVNINNMDRIDIVVGGDHGQDVFRFPMKLICIMDDEEMFEREVHVSYVYCRKDNGMICKNIIIMKLGESFKKYYIIFHYFSFNNQHPPITNVYMIDNLAF